MYELRGVAKEFAQGDVLVRAVDEVDLVIEDADFVVVEGPSGSGKTTLLQLLGGLERPTRGALLYDGDDLAAMSERRLAELRLRTFGFVFQQFNLIPTLTAAQNVEAALAPRHLSRDERRARVAELLERVQLSDRAEHLPTQLSGGQQQRVALARALANDPKVLLADEPTGNLDSSTGEQIVALFAELSDEGRTVVLITHDPRVAAAAPRALHMLDGHFEAEGTPR
ncbi:MAG: ABC transporter ATP-binding protein [Actinomycetota bacterium]